MSVYGLDRAAQEVLAAIDLPRHGRRNRNARRDRMAHLAEVHLAMAIGTARRLCADLISAEAERDQIREQRDELVKFQESIAEALNLDEWEPHDLFLTVRALRISDEEGR